MDMAFSDAGGHQDGNDRDSSLFDLPSKQKIEDKYKSDLLVIPEDGP